MGRVGLEHPLVTASKTPVSEKGGAKSDARDAPKPLQYPDLAALVKAWTEHIKAAIKALV
jgi:hypothetical protein